MKLIELIKEKLGIDPLELDGDLNRETLKKMQSTINKMAEESDAEKEQEDLLKEAEKAKTWADNLNKARQKKFAIKEARKLARTKKGMTSARATLLRKLGQIE